MLVLVLTTVPHVATTAACPVIELGTVHEIIKSAANRDVQAVPATVTVHAALKPVPVTLTIVPAAGTIVLGKTEVIEGPTVQIGQSDK